MGKGRKQEGFSGTCIKDTWTKPKRSRIKGGKWGLLGWRGAVGGKWRQLYLNNNKKCEEIEIFSLWDLWVLCP